MSSPPQVEFQVISCSPQRSEALGAALGRLLRAGDVVCLSGPLGAGKTVFCRGIGLGWGASRPLTSPTYNLAHEHERAGDDTRLIHIDLYRIAGVGDAESLGLEDYLAAGDILILEWAERIADALPAQRLWVDIFQGPGQRRELIFEAQGERPCALIEAWRRQIAAAA